MEKELNPKQKLFVDEYLKDLSATQAAIRAGYSAKTAHSQGPRLLEHVGVKQAIQKALEERKERAEISQDYVLKVILDTMERCRQVQPVYDRNGNPVMVETPQGEIAPAYEFDAKNALKAAELLGKHLGIFVDKQEVKVNGVQPIINVTVGKE